MDAGDAGKHATSGMVILRNKSGAGDCKSGACVMGAGPDEDMTSASRQNVWSPGQRKIARLCSTEAKQVTDRRKKTGRSD